MESDSSLCEQPTLMDASELKTRTRDFALAVIVMLDGLAKDRVSDHIGRQLLRSATSVGANYRAACRARSDSEMAAKLGIVLEEADESAFWLEMLVESGRLDERSLCDLRKECDELVRIIAASIITIRRRLAVREELTEYRTNIDSENLESEI